MTRVEKGIVYFLVKGYHKSDGVNEGQASYNLSFIPEVVPTTRR